MHKIPILLTQHFKHIQRIKIARRRMVLCHKSAYLKPIQVSWLWWINTCLIHVSFRLQCSYLFEYNYIFRIGGYYHINTIKECCQRLSMGSIKETSTYKQQSVINWKINFIAYNAQSSSQNGMAFHTIEIPNINYAHSINTPNFLAV